MQICIPAQTKDRTQSLRAGNLHEEIKIKDRNICGRTITQEEKKIMTYILDKNEKDELVVLKDGQQASPTDVLEVYPDKRVYALRGQMGAGKTTFTKALCEAMGTEDVVNSPTFAIVNVYEDKDGEEIYHFDCYRLKSVAEAMDFGAEEYLYSGQYCFIEWPEMIEEILPEDTVDINIRLLEDGRRELTL